MFNLQAGAALPLEEKPWSLKANDMRAVLFVDQAFLQRSLGRELGCLGFDVILPATLDGARRSLQPSLRPADLLVMNFGNADGNSLDLLDVIWEHALKISVVLPMELDSFRDSVRRLCGPRTRGGSVAEHGDQAPDETPVA